MIGFTATYLSRLDRHELYLTNDASNQDETPPKASISLGCSCFSCLGAWLPCFAKKLLNWVSCRSPTSLHTPYADFGNLPIMLRLWSQVCVIVGLMVGAVSSHSRDVAARRGFTPQAIEEMKARSLYGRQVEAPEKRYYTNDTKGKSNSAWPCHPLLLSDHHKRSRLSDTRIFCRVLARYPTRVHDGDVQRRDQSQQVRR